MRPAANARQLQIFKGLALLAYVLAVHGIDTLAAQNVHWLTDWHVFRIQSDSGFDAFKFTAWFVVPLVVFLPTIDWQFFTFRRWKLVDFYLLAFFALVAVVVVAAIPLFPDLRETYSPVSDMSGPARMQYLFHQLTWTLSWLVGWEFLHRYVLLTRLRHWWAPQAWVVVPIVEGLYHVVQGKDWLESLGMVVFSVVMCAWTIKRDNVLLPFFAHLMIELALIGFLLMG
jgi:membrane protease YdiL (CAAX protease family)